MQLKIDYEFPELRRVAKEQYDYWQPETVLIESKASGLPLTYELRNMGIPVVNYTPSVEMINILVLILLHLCLNLVIYGLL